MAQYEHRGALMGSKSYVKLPAEACAAPTSNSCTVSTACQKAFWLAFSPRAAMAVVPRYKPFVCLRVRAGC